MSCFRSVRGQSTLPTAAGLILLIELASTLALPMTTWTSIDFAKLSDTLPNIKPTTQALSPVHVSNIPSSAIVYSFTSSPPGSAHVLSSGSIYLPTRLTLSDTFLILFRRLHSLGFTNGILECLAVFWALVGFTIGFLWGLSIYIRRREARARRQRSPQHEDVTIEVKISRRPADSGLILSPRSALFIPNRKPSHGIASSKSVRWAEQLTSDEPRTPPPQYEAARQCGIGNSAVDVDDEVDITTCSSPTGRRRRHSIAYSSDRVRRVVAMLKAGGSNQEGCDKVEDVMLALEGHMA